MQDRHKAIKAAGEVSDAILIYVEGKERLKIENQELDEDHILKDWYSINIEKYERFINILEIRLARLLDRSLGLQKNGEL